MAKKMTIEDIRLKEKKLREKKKMIIAKEHEKIGKKMCKEFGLKDYQDFEQWLAENAPKKESENHAEKVEEKSAKSSYSFLSY